MSSAVIQFESRMPARSSAAGAQLRLTPRGRLVILMAVLLVAFAALTMLSGRADSTDQDTRVAAEIVVVEPGLTLWEIAAEVAPEQDPRTVVADIVDLNALGDAGAILVGQSLFVPEY
ncbi:MAG: LysM peptidoglycan-binding domain-containing protein [Nocardioidaceae bacterium]